MKKHKENPADVNLRDKDGNTAFDVADMLSHSSSALYLWVKGTEFSVTKGAGNIYYTNNSKTFYIFGLKPFPLM
jgi:hypothetical protein